MFNSSTNLCAIKATICSYNTVLKNLKWYVVKYFSLDMHLNFMRHEICIILLVTFLKRLMNNAF